MPSKMAVLHRTKLSSANQNKKGARVFEFQYSMLWILTRDFRDLQLQHATATRRRFFVGPLKLVDGRAWK